MFFFPSQSVKRSVCVDLDTVMLFHGFNLNMSCCSWKHVINDTGLFAAKNRQYFTFSQGALKNGLAYVAPDVSHILIHF